MQNDIKVFSSDITRGHKPLENNLYDLFKVVPAKPIRVSKELGSDCDFKPKCDKHYIPKKKSKLKVKTIRDIRNLFEKDVYTELPNELEKQRILLLRKITAGSSRDENTKSLAKKMLVHDKPISRSAWQMLMNLNPEGHSHCFQYVLWNGKRIRVNGGKGGKNKFLCNYDLANKKKDVNNKFIGEKKNDKKKKGLLQNSLSIRFKPGPLTKKKHLDDSYQKHNVGDIELVNLPKLGLDIKPTFGVAVEPQITNLIQHFLEDDGTITQKWAEFAVSVLGTIKDAKIYPNSTENSVFFNLNYKCDQRRILMRRDLDSIKMKRSNFDYSYDNTFSSTGEPAITHEVCNVMSKILDSVEISLSQDSIYSEDEPRETIQDNSVKEVIPTKEKVKKRIGGELSRLDVTIIRLPEDPQNKIENTCSNPSCTLGCICASLQCSYILRQHCGRIECMFECKCDFTKYTVTDSFDGDCPELIPGLLNLDNEINFKLAKEEQKFRQTVVMSGDKSILLKSEKRSCKASTRYADFYNNMSLKSEYMAKKILTVVEVKLNCKNIEPWCMVHNLYKCFCKGKFTANSLSEKAMDEKDVNQTTIHEGERNDVENSSNKANESEIKTTNNNSRTRPDINSIGLISKRHTTLDRSITAENYASYYEEGNSCARTKPFTERKYYNSYYLSTHKKIYEMEKNDTKLEKRLMNIICKMDSFVEGAGDNNNSIVAYDKLHEQEITNNKDKSSLTYGKSELQLQEINKIKVKTNVNRDKSESSHHEAAEMCDRNIATRSKRKLRLHEVTKPSDNSSEPYGESEFHHQKVAKIKDNNNAARDKSELCDQEITHNDHYESAKTNDSKNVAQDNIELHYLEFTKLDDSNPRELPPVVKETDTQLSSIVNESESSRCSLNFDAKISSKPLPNKTKLIAWLEASYKQYKELVDQGKVKIALDSPKYGKVALYPWDFILDRYKTRKNLFLVTKHKPFRIFMAIDVKNAFFENCMNIDEIRFAELYKYPVTIKHLLTNATDLKDNFCILCGLSQCWELVGSVTKLPESGRNEGECDSLPDAFNWDQTTSHDNTQNVDDIKMDDVLSHGSQAMDVDIQIIPSNSSENYNDSDWSKWFVMTVENDFTEIQFYKRGFFVKYETIIKAINVARMSGKTVRLTYRKCVDRCNPQFGIYAIPNANEYCVFVGPYDKEEPLGIETVNCKTDDGKSKKTRGVWITTKKVDNVKLIDNPLSFMPANDLHPSNIVLIEGDCMSDNKNGDMKEPDQMVTANVSSSTKIQQNPTEERSKFVKPIRIHKTNGFYHLKPKVLLKQITSKEKVDSRNSTESDSCLQEPIYITKSLNINSLPIINAPPLVLNSLLSSNVSNLKSLLLNRRSDETPSSSISLLNSTATSLKSYHNVSVEYKKPEAETAPQIKIVGVYSENGDAINTKIDTKKSEGGMFILKPEEINKRLMENKITSDAKSLSIKGSEIIKDKKERDRDIENFLATSNVCTAPNTDIYIISDEEDEIEISKNLQNWQEVWITCTNIENLGMLRGRQDIDKNLSFEFPGFKFTEFYPQEDAFFKINQVLSRMVYVPKNITLEWTVIDSEEEVADKLLLKLDELGIDIVLTKRGLRHKSDLMAHRESVMKSRIKEGPDT